MGKNCLARWGGQFSTSVGSLTCLGQKFYNATAQETQWWGSPNDTEPNPHPLSNFTHLRQAWDNVAVEIEWQTPRKAILDMRKGCLSQITSIFWSESCVLGTICPSFFLLPLTRGEYPGIPIYENRGGQREGCTLQIGNWKDY